MRVDLRLILQMGYPNPWCQWSDEMVLALADRTVTTPAESRSHGGLVRDISISLAIPAFVARPFWRGCAGTSHTQAMRHLLAFVITLLSSIAQAHAQTATIDSVGCGTGCRQLVTQLNPVSRTAGGYPRVLVVNKTILHPGSGQTLLGYDRAGDPIVKFRGELYPRFEKSWIIADCHNRRVALHVKHGNGLDAIWSQAYTESGEPNNCHSACGRAYDQWRLLCRAAGEL